MVGNVSEETFKLPHSRAKIELERLPERVRALDGLDRLRAVAGEMPVYLVGGVVRDLLLGRERTDLDLAVEGDAAELGRRLGGEVRTHQRFATATVTLDGLEVDLATARSETYAKPGALPEVRPATIGDDLARRDFAVNAMAVPLVDEPELIDPHGGARDLQAGLLRVLHERSFVDDPTRALRAARYAARYGFELEADTAGLLRAADLGTVSRDRIEAELRKLAAEPRAREGFALLDAWGLVTVDGDALELIDRIGKLVDSEPWKDFAPRADAVLAAALGGGVDAVHELAAAGPGRPSEAVELAHGRDAVALVLARALGADWLDRYVTEWRHVRLEIDGDDLLEASVPEGPAIGRGLEAALRAKLDGEVEGREEELAIALEAAGK